MTALVALERLLRKAEQIAGIEKCTHCSCLMDILRELRWGVDEFLEGQQGHLVQRIENLIARCPVAHGCLGCDPCYPVEISNRLADLGLTAEIPAGASCGAGEAVRFKATEQREGMRWPVEAGEYLLGSPTAPLAVCTLLDHPLPGRVLETFGEKQLAIAGLMETENIGIEKVVRNLVSNPAIHTLILCGSDGRGDRKIGHFAGQSLAALHANGLDERGRILGARGRRPFLKNLRPEEIRRFRESVTLVDRIGETDATALAAAAGKISPRTVAPSVLPTEEVSRIKATARGSVTLDPKGYFIILLDRPGGKIVVEHYTREGVRTHVIEGHEPKGLYATIIRLDLLSRLDHAAYLGRELERVYRALLTGEPYVQDAALGG